MSEAELTDGDALEILQSAFGHHFARCDLLEEALTHSSAAGEGQPSLERLEFLGDRVLGLIVARLLFDLYADENEGALSRRLTALVRREALVRVAETIGLGRHIILSPGEEDSGGRSNPGILSDICEALIAALYLDGGLPAAERFVRTHWTGLMKENLTPPRMPRPNFRNGPRGGGCPCPSMT